MWLKLDEEFFVIGAKNKVAQKTITSLCLFTVEMNSQKNDKRVILETLLLA